MSEKRNTYDQNRRDAMYWAEEWRIKQRKRKILIAIGAVVAVIALGFIINYISILGSRTVFSSEEEMKAYVQGRFAAERYVEFDFDGDDRVVDTSVKRIRKKLPEGCGLQLRSVYGVGYKLEAADNA